MGERRLGWLAITAALLAVLVLVAVLSRLPGLADRPDTSSPLDEPGPSAAGNAAVGSASSPPDGASTPPPPTGRDPGSPNPPPGRGTDRSSPTAGPAEPITAVPPPTAGPGPTAGPVGAPQMPPDVHTAIADLRAAIREQVDAGQLAPAAGDDLLSKVDQIAREVSGGDRVSARFYAGRLRDKLGKYRDDGTLSLVGHQTLISRLAVLDQALA